MTKLRLGRQVFLRSTPLGRAARGGRGPSEYDALRGHGDLRRAFNGPALFVDLTTGERGGGADLDIPARVRTRTGIDRGFTDLIDSPLPAARLPAVTLRTAGAPCLSSPPWLCLLVPVQWLATQGGGQHNAGRSLVAFRVLVAAL